MIKVKICGITRLEDATLAAELGAWAVGFIFVKESPRYIAPESAGVIIKQLPIGLKKIGVFANLSPDEVENYVIKSEITGIQLHGDESVEVCQEISSRFDLPVFKALRVKNSNDLAVIARYKDIVSAILLDSFSEKELGGTGKTFNWEIAKQAKAFDTPIILAGGLNPNNILDAYTDVQPYALDVSSGVEEDKGIKSSEKLIKLFSNIFS